ncbi:MAG: NUDIX domain-containing protein [Pseudomonadota bacterium]
MTRPVFLFGTLLDPELYEIVSGAPFAARPAKLEDARVHWVDGEAYPTLVATPGQKAPGILVSPKDAARARLDFYELGFGYALETRRVQSEDGPVDADIYVAQGDQPIGAAWSFQEWQQEHAALARLAAREYILLQDTHTPEAAARTFPQIRVRAASWLRARREPSPEPFSPKMAAHTVRPERTEQPYTDFFAVREDWLKFPKFGGGEGPLVKRATFLGGDAVTVLPYDPSIDSVLIIRQFRHGAFVRGDSNAWALEPAAGRIDPGEGPEDTAKRELLEETGVVATSLHLVGRYYPSPGAYSEYLYSYVATADLAGEDGGVAGLETEGEDIMRHVVRFSDATAMIETGAINTGPLILSLGWLALNKAKFT